MKFANDNGTTPEDRGEATAKPCPICGKAATASMRPFCSKRCADVDLHRWLGGRYAIPIQEGADDEEATDDEGPH